MILAFLLKAMSAAECSARRPATMPEKLIHLRAQIVHLLFARKHMLIEGGAVFRRGVDLLVDLLFPLLVTVLKAFEPVDLVGAMH